ncbi:MAG: hydroxymethylglutaryl-CoA synthase [Natronomonas sp.]|jgi:hydroxymethylglutaryl-CoA synthase
MSRGILAVGAYAPENRVPAAAFEEAWGSFDAPGVETKAVPDADEDALTMGVQAGRRALSAGDADSEAIDHLAFATTNPPLAEEDQTPRLGSYLGVPDSATRRTHTGSIRAGVDALFDALETDGTALVVVSDCPEGEPDDSREHAAGAGAVAFVVGEEAPATVTDRATESEVRPGTRFRGHGERDVSGLDTGTYSRAAFREPIAAAVDALSVDTEADAVALQAPNGKLPYRASLDNGAIAAVETVSELGDTAAASVPLSLAKAFTEGYDRTLAVAWGSGAGATAFVVEGVAPVETALDGDRELDYPAYLRRRGDIVGEKPDGGAAHVSVPTWQRSVAQRHRHEAGRCPECGAVAFPPDGACPDCRALVEFEPVTPELTGTVDAATTIGQGGAPPEFAEQQARQGAFGAAIVRFSAGDGEVSLPMQATESVDVGDTVRAVPRRVYVEEGVPRYGLKALPQD